MKIVAIDFETANHSPLSACALGLAIFESDGGFSRSSDSEIRLKPKPHSFQLISSPYWLIKPPKGHGGFDVHDKPEFSEIAPEVVTYLASADLVVRTMPASICASYTPCWSILKSPRHPSSINAP